jgi:hypothetical protein
MKSLIWKEWHENLKWILVPILLILGPMTLFGTFALMEMGSLFYVGLVAAVFGAMLGFLQVFFESQGDKRSLLLHRPLSRSQIFLAKALAGVGLYLLALGIPFVWAVGLAATPGHHHQPFGWPMGLPWLADVLTGLVYYFAGMLTAQREARWYGSRCLGLAAGFFCSLVVWTVPEFWQALLAIALVGAVVALAAWGSFGAGGAYTPQPRPAKIALALTFLMGLSALDFTAKAFFGLLLAPKMEYQAVLDRHGRPLLITIVDGNYQSATDLAGNVPEELRAKRVGRYELREVEAPAASGGAPRLGSYRNVNRFCVKYGNETKPGIEDWWYVPAEGRLLGYDKVSKRFIGSFGPEGFCPPDEEPRGRFQGELRHLSVAYEAWAKDYLVFPGGVYFVDFRTLQVRTLFVPAAGETVLWASEWEDEKPKRTLAVVGTDRSVHVVDEVGTPVFSAPLAYDRQTYRVRLAGRLEGPERYWVWYEPHWYLSLDALDSLPAHVLTYDRAGQEILPRQDVPARAGGSRGINPPTFIVEPSPAQSAAGLVTGLAEAAFLTGTTQYLESGVRTNGGSEAPLLLRFLILTTQTFVPGVRWEPRAHAGLVIGSLALMLLSAAACALVSFRLARGAAFSRARCVGWSLCGLVWGPTGLLLLLALQDWPAHVPCPKCRKARVVTRDLCEHCGARHAPPTPDGTEIHDPAAAAPEAARECHLPLVTGP